VCDAAPTCKIDSVTSNEPVLDPGSGNTTPDWFIENPGPKASPATLGVQLRAERSGTGIGRIYTVNVSCSDKSGNTSTGKTTVSVSHDQGSGCCSTVSCHRLSAEISARARRLRTPAPGARCGSAPGIPHRAEP